MLRTHRDPTTPLSLPACSARPRRWLTAALLAGAILDALAPAARASPAGDAIIHALNGGGFRAGTWGVSERNTLDAIVQTPPIGHWDKPYAELSLASTCKPRTAGCDADFQLLTCTTQRDCTGTAVCDTLEASSPGGGVAAKKLCIGHSDKELLDRIHRLVTGASKSVDITTLAHPDGRFVAALRNAITALDKSGKPVTIRILIGPFLAAKFDPDDVLANLTRDVAKQTKLKVFVGKYAVDYYNGGWNHSKIVAIDGKTALVGGHNLFTGSYLDATPAHDISIEVSGAAALDATRFADVLWAHTCTSIANPKQMKQSTVGAAALGGSAACPAAAASLPVDPPSTAGAAKIISVGRMSDLVARGQNPADLALLTLISQATSTLYLSQQQLGLPLDVPWVPQFLTGTRRHVAVQQAIAAALDRGVQVHVVVASENGEPLGYGGGNPAAIAQEIVQYTQEPYAACRLWVAPLRFSDEENPYELRAGRPGNHAKVAIADESLAYVGSQNLYPADLSEFGFILDDATAARRLVTDYWDNLWFSSRNLKVRGAPAYRCQSLASRKQLLRDIDNAREIELAKQTLAELQKLLKSLESK